MTTPPATPTGEPTTEPPTGPSTEPGSSASPELPLDPGGNNRPENDNPVTR